jgi:DNA-binding transcriptional ArsR family regulator
VETLASTSDVTILQAIADPVRYQILRRLVKSPATQKQLAEEFELNSGTLSKHMAKLSGAHLVFRQRSHAPYQLQSRDGVWRMLQGYTNLKKEIAAALYEATSREDADLNRAGMRNENASVQSEGM